MIRLGAVLLSLLLLAAVALKSGHLGAPPQVGPGGAFSLVNSDGQPVNESVLKGKWSVVFFGFTYCPDVCPTTLADLAQAKVRLGPKADKLQVVFISVDPDRDTPAQLKAYLSNDAFPKGTLGLTGTPDQIRSVTSAYKVYYEKSGTGGDYVVNHSSASYLMDPKGRFVRVLPYGLGPSELANQISLAMPG